MRHAFEPVRSSNDAWYAMAPTRIVSRRGAGPNVNLDEAIRSAELTSYEVWRG